MTTGERLSQSQSQAQTVPPVAASARVDWRGVALVAAFCVLPVLDQFAHPLRTLDETLLLVHPEQVLAGRVPHSDFFTVYGPGGYGLLAAVYAAFGPEIVIERGVGLAYHVALATGMFQFTSPLGKSASRTAGATSALALAPIGLTAYAWLGGLALSVWSLALLVRPEGRRWAFSAGVVGGLVPAWRFEMIVLLAASAPLIWRTSSAKPYLKGMVAGLVPTLLFLATSGADASTNVIQSRLAVNAQLPLEDVHAMVWTGVAISLATSIFLLRLALRRSPIRRLATASLVLSVLLLPQMLQRIDLTHVLFGACVTAPLGLAFAIGHRPHLDAEPPMPLLRGLTAALTAALLAVLTASAVTSLRNPIVTEVRNNNRSVLVRETQAEELTQLLSAIKETIPTGSSIFVGAEDMSVPTLSRIELYHLLPEYRSEAYYLDLPPGVAEQEGSRLLDDVLRADALILTEVPRVLSESLFPQMAAGVQTVNQAVQSAFCPQRSVSATTIYLRCDAETEQMGAPTQSVGALRSRT